MLSLPIHWRWLIVPSLLLLSNLFALPLVHAHYDNFEYPIKFLQEHREKILTLSSDQEALEFHQNLMKKLRQSAHPSTPRKPSTTNNASDRFSQEMQETITTFWAAMATIGHIQKLRAFLDTRLDNQFFSENLPTDAQQIWIQSKPSLVKYTHLLEAQKKLPMASVQEPIALPLGVEAQVYETAWKAWHGIQQWQQQETNLSCQNETLWNLEMDHP